MTNAQSMRGHASLAPSASKRWMICPGSISRSVGEESRSSVFAKEGTAAHELCERVMRDDLDPHSFLGGIVGLEGEWVGVHPPERRPLPKPDGDNLWRIDAEMVESVIEYRDAIKERMEPDTSALFETRLDMRHVHPGLWGTADAILYNKRLSKMHVLDFKYGSGIAVEAEENSQLLCYAIGAARHLQYDMDTIEIVVVQPRAYHVAGPIRTFEISIIDLLIFEAFLMRAASITDDPNSRIETGEHCRFCPVAGRCPELRDAAIAAIKARKVKGVLRMPALEHLDSDELGAIFKQAQLVEIWIRRFFEYAHDRALSGHIPTGLKLVEGRSYRKWKDADGVALDLELLGFSEEDFMSEPELKSVAVVEKLVGKKAFKMDFEDRAKKPPGNPVLAPIEDARNAINIDKSSAFGAVEDEE